jgi:hypothetical protein
MKTLRYGSSKSTVKPIGVTAGSRRNASGVGQVLRQKGHLLKSRCVMAILGAGSEALDRKCEGTVAHSGLLRSPFAGYTASLDQLGTIVADPERES